MKELTKKCIGLISNTLVQLGQTKTDKDILILASTLAEDLMRDWSNLSWNDVEEAFRSGIRGERFVVNVQTYYILLYRKRKGTGLLTIKKLL